MAISLSTLDSDTEIIKKRTAKFIQDNPWAKEHKRLVIIILKTYDDYLSTNGDTISDKKTRKQLGDAFIRFWAELHKFKPKYEVNTKENGENPLELRIEDSFAV